MRGYYETGDDNQPTHTDEGHAISSHALNGFGEPIITLADEIDATEVTLTVDSVELTFSRPDADAEFFTGQTVGLEG
jgi:hypothetical protein